ncbi:MAG: sulfate transporter family protein [Rhizobiaceae bacterium]|nr:sulfate transporter family protein [Rhizobiaceae bacterium]
MILSAAGQALGEVLSPPFRAALWKSLGLSIVVLVALWFGVSAGFESAILPFLTDFLPDMPAWVDQAGTLAGWAAGLALAVLLAFLVGPVSAVIAGLFLDDVAEIVERESYPAVRRGQPLPVVRSMILSLKFFGIVLIGNLFALMLLLVPGVNLVAFFVVNGYLLGREYFEFAALRYRPETDAKAMRRRHKGRVMFAGLLVAGFLAIPVLNLLTPLFAAALMVHLHQRLAAREGGIPVLSEAGLTSVPADGRPPVPRSAPAGQAHRRS